MDSDEKILRFNNLWTVNIKSIHSNIKLLKYYSFGIKFQEKISQNSGSGFRFRNEDNNALNDIRDKSFFYHFLLQIQTYIPTPLAINK